jgi:hypothetical protein
MPGDTLFLVPFNSGLLRFAGVCFYEFCREAFLNAIQLKSRGKPHFRDFSPFHFGVRTVLLLRQKAVQAASYPDLQFTGPGDHSARARG